MRTFLLPRSDYQIIDNWHVAGLAGTGSKDIVVESAFVPEHRTHRFLDAFEFRSPGQEANQGTLFRLPFGCLFAFCIAVPAIGAAQGALDSYRTHMREKVAAYDGAKVADDPLAQRRLSEAAAEIDAARAEVRTTWDSICALAEHGETIPLALRARGRWNAANVVLRDVLAWERLAVEVLGLVVAERRAGGGIALRLDQQAQRIVLQPGPPDDLAYAGFEVDDEAERTRELLPSRAPTAASSRSRRRALAEPGPHLIEAILA